MRRCQLLSSRGGPESTTSFKISSSKDCRYTSVPYSSVPDCTGFVLFGGGSGLRLGVHGGVCRHFWGEGFHSFGDFFLIVWGDLGVSEGVLGFFGT